MTIAIIDYRAGNLTSVQRAVHRLGVEATISADPAVVTSAPAVIFPGVGAAASCMANLRAAGLDRALHDVVAAGTPLLGICIGMQLLFSHSEEDGGVDCLGLIPGTVRRFQPRDRSIKVPHMGWNRVRFAVAEPLAADLEPDPALYFVHSYHCVPDDPAMVVAHCDHGESFCAGVRHGSLVAVQFHPEKSGPVGLRILSAFCRQAGVGPCAGR